MIAVEILLSLLLSSDVCITCSLFHNRVVHKFLFLFIKGIITVYWSKFSRDYMFLS